jgi:predicted pyridoxine 5'-phosphate oxidase superfamily flavin-nucleotide-binding protein
MEARMADSILYNEGNRRLQDAFDSRRIADRLEAKLARTAFSDDDKAFIESAIYFFLATADAQGRPDSSFKGGPPGFVRVTAPDELAFPDYDGNGMFKSLGNLLENPHVGLLFIDMHGKPRRLRVNGEAKVSREDPLLAHTVGAQLIVRVKAHAIFPNCPRYIPKLALVEPSAYTPKPGCDPVEPAWKGFDAFKDAIHPRQPTARSEGPKDTGG